MFRNCKQNWKKRKKQLFEKQEKVRLEKEKSWGYNIDIIQSNIKAATAGQQLSRKGWTSVQNMNTRQVISQCAMYVIFYNLL